MANVTPLCVATSGQVRPFSTGAGDTLVGAAGAGTFPVAPSGGVYTTAAAGANSVAVGDAASTSGAQSQAFGRSASAAHADCTVLGDQAASTVTNQFVLGSSGSPRSTLYLGPNGVQATTPTAGVNWRATNATPGGGNNDKAGAGLLIAPGAGTGAGAGSVIDFYTPTAGASGDTAQTLFRRFTVRLNGATCSGTPQASGTSAEAFGYDATAAGNQALALGYNATASEAESIAIGMNATTRTNSVVIGRYANISATFTDGVVIGRNGSASASNATAVGHGASVTAAGGTALGHGTTCGHTSSVALGISASTTLANQLHLGAITDIRGTGAMALTGVNANLTLSTVSGGALDIDSVGILSINASSTSAINIGNDTDTGAINVGVGASARTITVGNVTGATAIVLNTGSGNITVSDATNFVFNTTTGTKFGTATSQKIGFFNAAPVVQQTNVANPTGGATIDAESRTAIDGILSRLETLGLFAA